MEALNSHIKNHRSYLSILGPEQFLLYLCVLHYLEHPRVKLVGSEIEEKIEFDLSKFEHATMDSGLWPIISPWISTVLSDYTCADNCLIEKISSQAQKDRVDNLVRNVQVKKQILEIGRSFNKASIEYILLKGSSSLITNLWKHPSDRNLSDLDILVKDIHLERAVSTLAEDGYHFDREEAISRKHHHHFPALVKVDGPALPVELHTRVGSYRFLHDMKTVDLFKAKEIVSIEGVDLYILSQIDQCKLAHLHSSHYFGSVHKAGVQFRDFLEVLLLERRLNEASAYTIKNQDLITRLFDYTLDLLFDRESCDKPIYGRTANYFYLRVLKMLMIDPRWDPCRTAMTTGYNAYRSGFRIVNNPSREISRRVSQKFKKRFVRSERLF